MKDHRGLVIVYSGNGKGKTSAALGTALRASGHDFKVFIMQFVKGDWEYGEENAITNLPGVVLERKGLGFIGVKGDKYSKEDHKRTAQEGIDRVKDVVNSNEYDVIILDEINLALDVGLLNITEVLELLEKKPSGLHVILTGRKAPVDIVKNADIVSEILDVKHPYGGGFESVKGIDF